MGTGSGSGGGERLDPGRTALLLNDLIKAGLRRRDDPEHNRKVDDAGFVTNALQLVSALRPHHVPVFWVRVGRRGDRADVPDNQVDSPAAWHTSSPAIVSGTYAAEPIDEIVAAPEDQVVVKTRIDPFIGTDLDLQLRARRIETLAVGGYATNFGVESCARTAHDLGYNVIVLSDCCWNVDAEAHAASLKHNIPLFARVLTSGELLSRLG